MNSKTSEYVALVDGVLSLAARNLSASEYEGLRRVMAEMTYSQKDCPKAAPGLPCTFPRWHHGPHSWEKQEQRASDALAAYQMASMGPPRPAMCMVSEYQKGTCVFVKGHRGQHSYEHGNEEKKPPARAHLKGCVLDVGHSEGCYVPFVRQSTTKPCPVVGCPMDASPHVHGVVATGTPQQGGVIGVGPAHVSRPEVVRTITYSHGMGGGPMRTETRVETGCSCAGLLHDADCTKAVQQTKVMDAGRALFFCANPACRYKLVVATSGDTCEGCRAVRKDNE